MIEKAVIDRFEGEDAILFFQENNKSLKVKKSVLPKEAIEGDWLQIERSGENLLNIKIDKNYKEEVKKRIQEKMENLRRGNQLK